MSPSASLVAFIASAALGLTCVAFGVTNAQSYQSNKYPAGLHPSLCPHYPYCDNAALGGFVRDVAAIRHGGSDVPGYPASLSPHACPNYPYCSHQIPLEAAHYRRGVGVATAIKYPSGVDPASCPGYPYCH